MINNANKLRNMQSITRHYVTVKINISNNNNFNIRLLLKGEK